MLSEDGVIHKETVLKLVADVDVDPSKEDLSTLFHTVSYLMYPTLLLQCWIHFH